MSQQTPPSSAGGPRAVRQTVVPQRAPSTPPHLIGRDSEGRLVAPQPRPRQPRVPRKGREKGEKRGFEQRMRSKLPEGVYDQRPRMKRYVLHWAYFWVYTLLDLHIGTHLPTPRASHAERQLIMSKALRIDRKRLHIVDVFAGEKGGVGKTTNGVASAATEALVTGALCLVFDNNQTRGTTASAVGVTQTLSVRQLIQINEKWPELLTTDWLTTHLGVHPVYGNLFVVTSDIAKDRKKYPVISEERVARLIAKLSECFERIMFDQGNNPEMPAQVAAVKAAKVLRFVFDPRVDNAIQNCIDTMDYYRDIVPEKVQNAVLVVSAHRRSDMDASYYASLFDIPVEQVVLMPFERNLEPPRGKKPKQQIVTVDDRLQELARLTRPILLARYGARYRTAHLHAELVARRMAAKNIAARVVPPTIPVPLEARSDQDTMVIFDHVMGIGEASVPSTSL